MRPGPVFSALFLALLTIACSAKRSHQAVLSPAAPGVLEGRVVTQGGEPIPGVGLRIFGLSPRKGVLTDAFGRFRIEGLDAGEYLFELVAPQSQSSSLPTPWLVAGGERRYAAGTGGIELVAAGDWLVVTQPDEVDEADSYWTAHVQRIRTHDDGSTSRRFLSSLEVDRGESLVYLGDLDPENSIGLIAFALEAPTIEHVWSAPWNDDLFECELRAPDPSELGAVRLSVRDEDGAEISPNTVTVYSAVNGFNRSELTREVVEEGEILGPLSAASYRIEVRPGTDDEFYLPLELHADVTEGRTTEVSGTTRVGGADSALRQDRRRRSAPYRCSRRAPFAVALSSVVRGSPRVV